MSAYAIGPDGLLSPLVPPVVPAGGGPFGIAVAPSGSVLYVANNWDSTVSAYAIGSNGLLTPVGVYVTGAFPAGIVVVP
jgi:DNA-binding beta-propeller fold protein YncE